MEAVGHEHTLNKKGGGGCEERGDLSQTNIVRCMLR